MMLSYPAARACCQLSMSASSVYELSQHQRQMLVYPKKGMSLLAACTSIRGFLPWHILFRLAGSHFFCCGWITRCLAGGCWMSSVCAAGVMHQYACMPLYKTSYKTFMTGLHGSLLLLADSTTIQSIQLPGYVLLTCPLHGRACRPAELHHTPFCAWVKVEGIQTTGSIQGPGPGVAIYQHRIAQIRRRQHLKSHSL